ncbi:MAG: endonuclease/exonuclease/phosphatase family protein [Flavobacteriaceae bacterium]|nr:endonuclease/exonuclease/phosphatase family protein [Flavobacteriaceae bacterium]
MAKNKLTFINKIFFLLNNVFAVALVISFFIPKLSPEKYGILALLSLLTPVLIIINFIFIIYWTIIGFKKQLLLSFFVLLLSLLFIPSVYKFYNNDTSNNKNSLSIMSYNVRKFNKYKWLKTENIESKISKFINEEDPDILALQEYQNIKSFELDYPYYSNPLKNLYSDPVENKKHRISQVVFSKYPIINEGLIRNTKFLVCGMYIDIVKKKDTLRIYNFHLESLGVIPNEDYFGHKDSEKLIKRLSSSFKIQQQQIDTLNKNVKNCKYKVILVGDLNNTAYSWAYKNIKNDLQDSFLEAGKGFGKTYEFKRFPLRIDYIFVDENIKVTAHKNFKQKYSDHYPISATVEF